MGYGVRLQSLTLDSIIPLTVLGGSYQAFISMFTSYVALGSTWLTRQCEDAMRNRDKTSSVLLSCWTDWLTAQAACTLLLLYYYSPLAPFQSGLLKQIESGCLFSEFFKFWFPWPDFKLALPSLCDISILKNPICLDMGVELWNPLIWKALWEGTTEQGCYTENF